MSTCVGHLFVVFSTYNRAMPLRWVLDGYVNATKLEIYWVLVVVDDNSSDGTADLLIECSARLPMTMLSNPRPGKNISLHRIKVVVHGRGGVSEVVDLGVEREGDVVAQRLEARVADQRGNVVLVT